MLNAKEGLQTAAKPDGALKEAVSMEPVSEALRAGSSGASPRIPELIAELDELRQRGIISEEEFQAKKRELLDRL
jgi:hypothetical protein